MQYCFTVGCTAAIKHFPNLGSGHPLSPVVILSCGFSCPLFPSLFRPVPPVQPPLSLPRPYFFSLNPVPSLLPVPPLLRVSCPSLMSVGPFFALRPPPVPQLVLLCVFSLPWPHPSCPGPIPLSCSSSFSPPTPLLCPCSLLCLALLSSSC